MAKRYDRGSGGGGDRPSRGMRKTAGPPRDRREGPHPARPGPARRRPPVPRSLRIIHEDDDLLVVDKPPGIVTAHLMKTPGAAPAGVGGRRESLFDMVKEHVRSSRKRRGQGRVWIIHRLDKEASGLLVFAKSERAFNWLKEDFRAKRIHRLYLAVVEGAIGEEAGAAPVPEGSGRRRVRQLPAGTIQSFIVEGEEGESARSVALGDVARESAPPPRSSARAPDPRGPRSFGRSRAGPAGHSGSEPRLAVTHYRVLAVSQGRSLLQLRLETGRKNQIRVHMREFKHPVAGDRRYGAQTDPVGRVCLHATELGFTNPATGQAMRFSSPAPASFYRLIGKEPPPAAEEASAARSGGVEGARTAVATPSRSVAETSWEHVAEWYDALVEEERSDHFQQVIMPGALRLLGVTPGLRVLDIACGQGALCRKLAELGVDAVGIDAAPRLIEAARRRTAEAGVEVRYEIGDARQLDQMQSQLGASEHPFDAAVSIMALMNIDPLEPVLQSAAALLKPGGAFIAVILHPAFRAPRQTSWGWEEEEPRHPAGRASTRGRGGRPATRLRQFRRIDGYLSPGQVAITMNPGYAAHGAEEIRTWTFHRPLQAYIKALAAAGFVVEALEEWPSLRQSQPGPRAAEENRIRREIPMFLGLRAVKRTDPAGA